MLTDYLRIACLIPYPPNTTPSQRFRIEQWSPHLSQMGIEVEHIPFATKQLMQSMQQSGYFIRKAAGLSVAFLHSAFRTLFLRKYDAILIHRAISIAGPAVLERVAALQRPIIYDFDDAIWMLHTSEVNRRFAWLKFPGKTETICKLSSHITVGNGFLAEFANQFNSQFTIIPTSINTDHYFPSNTHVTSNPIVIGWTGSSTSQTHLEAFAPTLGDLLKSPNLELRVISNRRPELGSIPCTWRAWSPETEVQELAQLDIGIMPMPDDPWSRGKCSLKALQYMAMGIPTICSAVGTNCEVIQHGINGLLAHTPEDWITHLNFLINNPQERRRLGRAGRQTVEDHYSTKHCAKLFAQVVYKVLGRSDEFNKRFAESSTASESL